jgi:hypothetical protein
MITRIKTGSSFKGAGLYYLHDKRRPGESERLTTGRVAWTFAHNTLEEDPKAVLAEMRHTAVSQPLLKHLSGNRMDGRPTERAVMTVSLAWSPEEGPDKEQMVEAGLSFLKEMRWDQHQVLFVAHNDTRHPHVHLIINRIHPETGMTLDDSWSKTRAQRWALAYEREHGRIFCEEREARYGSRPSRHPRDISYRDWLSLVQFEHRSDDPELRRVLQAGEWFGLKRAQQEERKDFLKESAEMRKDLRTALAMEVRKEFANDWRSYVLQRDERLKTAKRYDAEAQRAIRYYSKLRGVEAIAQVKERQKAYHDRLHTELYDQRKAIGDRQKERLKELAAPAFEKLAEDRKRAYRELLARQREERARLKKDQASGNARPDLLPGAARSAPVSNTLLTPQQSSAYVQFARSARPVNSRPLREPDSARPGWAIAAGLDAREIPIPQSEERQDSAPKPHPFLQWELERTTKGREVDRDR